jgi:5'(3')-deoxyribonucleotidase
MRSDKKVLYIDMDGVLVNFQSGIDKLSQEEKLKYKGQEKNVPHIFSKMDPIEGAIDAFKLLSEYYDTYILSTAPWNNETALGDKVAWAKKYLGETIYKRLILSHNKHLNNGDYLIDDRPDKNGAGDFYGKLIHFGSNEFPDWESVLKFLIADKV